MLLTDDAGFIVNVNKKFVDRFLDGSIETIDENRFNIDDVFVGLNLISEEDQVLGFKTQMISNFSINNNQLMPY
jgi:hypothetical protein